MVDKVKILTGRKAVDAYRTAHSQLHAGGWHKGIPEEHTLLLQIMIKALEGLGFTSTETDFEPKKTEILAKFWADSDGLNIQELGFIDKDDYMARATRAEKESRMGKWH